MSIKRGEEPDSTPQNGVQAKQIPSEPNEVPNVLAHTGEPRIEANSGVKAGPNDKDIHIHVPKEDEPFSYKLLLALVVAVLSFLGAAGGTIVGSFYGEAQWRREALLAYDQTILNKRVELVDRTARIINRRNSVKRLDVYIQNLVTMATLKPESGSGDAELKKVVDAALSRDDLNVELATILSLDALYFGPKTDKAIANLSKAGPDFWAADESLFQALLNALAQEFFDLDFGARRRSQKPGAEPRARRISRVSPPLSRKTRPSASAPGQGLAGELPVAELEALLLVHAMLSGLTDPEVTHERGQDAVRTGDGVRALEDLRTHRRTAQGRCGRAHSELCRPVPRHGLRATDLARIAARHRGLPGRQSSQAVPHGD